MKIGNTTGTYLGMDEITHNLLKVGFACICVLVDLSKDLSSSITVDGFEQPIDYEGNMGFCLRWGLVGHHTNFCRSQSSSKDPQPTSSIQERDLTPPSPKLGWITMRKKKRIHVFKDAGRSRTTTGKDSDSEKFKFES